MKPTHLLASLLALAAVPAAAHVVLAEPQAAAGSYYAGFFRVSHGCGASPTVALRVEIPATVVSAKPQPKPGWTVAIERTPLATPIRGEGGAEIRERVSAITWTGMLDIDSFDQFGIMMKLPATAGPLYFPTTQRCTSGSAAWTTIPAPGQPWHSVEHPAPVLDVQAAGGMAGIGGHGPPLIVESALSYLAAVCFKLADAHYPHHARYKPSAHRDG